mmetsp:Transcript_106967/g.244946  ORF Transcript_106967/g.244946 Transcript_106967/m.244946 type:complete len:205 (+) Transcript_106967:1086-1700(+)
MRLGTLGSQWRPRSMICHRPLAWRKGRLCLIWPQGISPRRHPRGRRGRSTSNFRLRPRSGYRDIGSDPHLPTAGGRPRKDPPSGATPTALRGPQCVGSPALQRLCPNYAGRRFPVQGRDHHRSPGLPPAWGPRGTRSGLGFSSRPPRSPAACWASWIDCTPQPSSRHLLRCRAPLLGGRLVQRGPRRLGGPRFLAARWSRRSRC